MTHDYIAVSAIQQYCHICSPAGFGYNHLSGGLVELGPQVSAMEDDLHSISCHRLTRVLVGGDQTACVWMCLD